MIRRKLVLEYEGNIQLNVNKQLCLTANKPKPACTLKMHQLLGVDFMDEQKGSNINLVLVL